MRSIIEPEGKDDRSHGALIERRRQEACAAAHGWRPPVASAGGGGVVQLTGSVVENPHRLHWNTYKFSAKARLIVCSKVIGCPQTGQMTSFVGVTSLLIAHLWMRWRVPALT
jgi:hypothetical protein